MLAKAIGVSEISNEDDRAFGLWVIKRIQKGSGLQTPLQSPPFFPSQRKAKANQMERMAKRSRFRKSSVQQVDRLDRHRHKMNEIKKEGDEERNRAGKIKTRGLACLSFTYILVQPAMIMNGRTKHGM